MTTLVLDTTIVSHFARAGRLETLAALTKDHERLIPNEVAVELKRGAADHPALSDALGLPWLPIIELGFEEIVHVATFKAEMGGRPEQHLGECAVLAWALHNDGVAVVDETAAVKLAQHHDVKVRRTLALVIEGVRNGVLTRDEAEKLVDELAATDMYLPADGEKFFARVYAQGILP
ncbi:MAG TPA: hypothetical protein VIL36_00575 [Acidimicrobiales bacterium]